MDSAELKLRVERFLKDNPVDASAAEALRQNPPDVQLAALARGNLTDCRNPSAALLSRIRSANGTQMTSGLVDWPCTSCDYTNGGQDDKCKKCGEEKPSNAATAIATGASGSGDSSAAAAAHQQMAAYQQMMLASMMQGGSTDPAVAAYQQMLMAQLAMGGAAGMQPGTAADPGTLRMDVETFLAQNPVDMSAQESLRNAPAHVQQAVLRRGNLTDCRNASAALLGRIRQNGGSTLGSGGGLSG